MLCPFKDRPQNKPEPSLNYSISMQIGIPDYPAGNKPVSGGAGKLEVRQQH